MLEFKRQATSALLTDEKLRDVSQHQAVVKVVDRLIDLLVEPYKKIEELRVKFPLFAQEAKHTLRFNSKSGILELQKVVPAKK